LMKGHWMWLFQKKKMWKNYEHTHKLINTNQNRYHNS
jgi:hypothetical protein